MHECRPAQASICRGLRDAAQASEKQGLMKVVKSVGQNPPRNAQRQTTFAEFLRRRFGALKHQKLVSGEHPAAWGQAQQSNWLIVGQSGLWAVLSDRLRKAAAE